MGINTRGYRSYATSSHTSGGEPARYLAEKMGKDKAADLIRAEVHCASWKVIWFKPGVKEQYQIWMHIDGRYYSHGHIIEEDAPGAKLTEAEARTLAEDWLQTQGVDFSLYRFHDSSTRKRKNRNDHSFTWEKNQPKIDEARVRLSVNVQGSEVLKRADRIKIPDEYERERWKRTTRMAVFQGISDFIIFAASVAVFIVFVIQFARRRIRWRPAAVIGSVVAVTGLLAWINNLPTLYSGYYYTEPISRFIFTNLMRLGMSTVGAFIGATMFVGFGDALYRQSFPGKPSLVEWLSKAPWADWRSQAFRDGLFTILTALPLLGALALVWDKFSEAIMTETLGLSSTYSFSDYLDGLLPGLGVFIYVFSMSLMAIVSIALFAALARQFLKRGWIIVSALLVMILLGEGAEARSWAEFWQECLGVVVGLPLAYLFLTRWFGHNGYAYLMLVFTLGLLVEGMTLLESGDHFLIANGIPLIALAAVPILLSLYLRVRSPRTTTPDPVVEEGTPVFQEERN